MHVLIVKTSSFGDILQTFPVLDYLRTFWEPLTIDWVVETPCRTLLERHPYIDHVIPFDSKTWRKQWYQRRAWGEFFRFKRCLQRNTYDVVFDLQGNIKSGLITYLAKSRNKVGFGSHSVPEWPNLWATTHQYDPPDEGNIREDYLYLVQTFFQDDRLPPEKKAALRLTRSEQQQRLLLKKRLETVRPLFLVCPWSRWENKTLSEKTLHHFLHLVHSQYRSYFLFLWGDEKERRRSAHLQQMFPRVSELLDRCSLPLLQNILLDVDAVVTMDSLPLHLAGSVHVPTFSIFGPSSAIKYCPDGPHHLSYQGECPYGKQFVKRCPVLRTCSTGLCMKGIDARTLFDKFHAWFENSKREQKDGQGTLGESIHPPPTTRSC